MSKEKTYMPQSSAGLTRYFDESQDSIKIKPEYVVVVSAGIIVMEIVLKLLAV